MNFLPLFVLSLVGFSLVISAHRSLTLDRGKVLGVIRAWRWRYLPGSVAALGAGLGVAYFFDTYVPWTRWGWFSAIGGEGNPVLGEADLGPSDFAMGLSIVLAVAFPLLLAAAAIREARAEEVAFRKGNQKKPGPRRVARAIYFGMIHCVIGVPIWAGLALSILGGWYDYVYQCGYERALGQIALAGAPAPAGPGTVAWAQQQLAAVVAEMDGAQAEDAGVNAAAAQHAAMNLFIVVIVEIAVLSDLGMI